MPLGPALEGAFRTPSLRCAAIQPSFLHTGQMRDLEEVGHAGGRYPGVNELEPLGLSERDIVGPGPSAELLAP